MAVKNNSLHVAYGQSQGLINEFPVPIVARRAPLPTDFSPLGQIWLDVPAQIAYILTAIVANAAVWQAMGAPAGGPLTQLTTTDDGAVIFPIAGNISLAGDLTNIAVTNTAPGTIGIALVNSPVILGTLTVNGLLTANAGETVVGAFTQSGGNFIANNDAAPATIRLGTGGAAKTVVIGSANTTSSLQLLSGTGDIVATSTDAITLTAAGLLGLESNDNAPGAVSILTNGGVAETLVIQAQQGTGANSVNISSVAGGVTLTGALATNQALNLIASNAAGGLTSTVGTGGYSFVAANGNITLNSGTGIVGISTDATNNTIDIGTGVAVKTIVIGVNNTTAITSLRSGSGGVNLNASINQPVNINSGTSTGTATIGNASATVVVAGAVSVNASVNANTNINTGTSTGTIAIGNALTTALNVVAPTNVNLSGALNTSIASTNNTGTVLIGNVNSTAVDIAGLTNVNASVNANTNINTGNSTGTIAIGNSLSTALNVVAPTNINVGGALNTNIASTNNSGTVSIGNAASGAITITSGAGNISLIGGGNRILIGNDATATLTTLGSTTAGARSTILGGDDTILGAGAAILVSTAPAGDIQIGSPAHTGIISLGVSTVNETIKIGTGTGSANSINIGGSGANVIAIGNTQAAGSISLGDAMTSGTIVIGGTGLNIGTMQIAPGTGAQRIEIANNNGTKAIEIGNGVNGNDIDIGNGVNIAAQVINIASGAAGADSTVNIMEGTSTAGTQSVNIMGGARAGLVNIGDGAAAHQITIGNAAAGNKTTIASPILALPGPVFIYTGAGAPGGALAVHVGDMYINTTAASAVTRLYIATAAGVWTNVTCAA